MREKYLPTLEVEHQVSTFGDTGIVVEMIGFDKVSKLQSRFESNCEVGVARMQIASLESDSASQLERLNVTDMDLSFNLFTEVRQVFEIGAHLKHLKSLMINNCCFNPIREPLPRRLCHHTLARLSLNKTRLQWDQLVLLEQTLPNLQELSIAYNEIDSIPRIPETAFRSLRTLLMEGNDIADIQSLSSLPKLHTLNVAGNRRIEDMTYESGFETLAYLNLNETGMHGWRSINALDRFPSLKELRIRDVPLVHGTEDARTFIIGRVGQLMTVNGSEVNEQERVDSERYYLKSVHRERVKNGWTLDQTLEMHPRYSLLLDKHGEPVLEQEGKHLLKNNLIEATLTHADTGDSKVKKFPLTTKVRVIRTIVSKLFRIPQDELVMEIQYDANLIEELDNDMKEIDFYVREDHCDISVRRRGC